MKPNPPTSPRPTVPCPNIPPWKERLALGTIIALVMFVVVEVLFAFACGGGTGGSNPRTGSFHAATTNGASVRSTRPISAETLASVDTQLDQLFARVTVLGYRDFRTHRAVSVEIVPRDPRCDEISMIVEQEVDPGTQYDQSVYDRDDRPGYLAICAGGRYLPTRDVILVTNEGVLAGLVVRYEAEHWFLYHHDRSRYEATKLHTEQTGHPILGE